MATGNVGGVDNTVSKIMIIISISTLLDSMSKLNVL